LVCKQPEAPDLPPFRRGWHRDMRPLDEAGGLPRSGRPQASRRGGSGRPPVLGAQRRRCQPERGSWWTWSRSFRD